MYAWVKLCNYKNVCFQIYNSNNILFSFFVLIINKLEDTTN